MVTLSEQVAALEAELKYTKKELRGMQEMVERDRVLVDRAKVLYGRMIDRSAQMERRPDKTWVLDVRLTDGMLYYGGVGALEAVVANVRRALFDFAVRR